jgi:hypothetical protein
MTQDNDDVRAKALADAYGQAVTRVFMVLCETTFDHASIERFHRGMANADRALEIAMNERNEAPDRVAALRA